MYANPPPPSLVFVSNPLYLRITKYIFIFPTVILVYDHSLTFAQEIERIWQRKLTANTVLFFILRYGSPIGTALLLMGVSPTTPTFVSCKTLIIGPMVVSVVAIAIVGVIMTIRTVALYGVNRYLAAILGLLLAAQFISHCIVIKDMNKGLFKLAQRCVVPPSNLASVFWLSPLVVDTIIFGLTLFRLQRLRKHVRERLTLFGVILRDGIMYYVVICCINLLIALNFLFSPVELKAIGANLGLTLSTTMTTRLILNLQGVSATYSSVATMSTSQSEYGRHGVLTTAPSVFFDQDQGLVRYPCRL